MLLAVKLDEESDVGNDVRIDQLDLLSEIEEGDVTHVYFEFYSVIDSVFLGVGLGTQAIHYDTCVCRDVVAVDWVLQFFERNSAQISAIKIDESLRKVFDFVFLFFDLCG